MKLIIEKNHKLIKLDNDLTLDNIQTTLMFNVRLITKGLDYQGKKYDIVHYNTQEELLRKLSIFNVCHVATIETEFDRFEIFLNK